VRTADKKVEGTGAGADPVPEVRRAALGSDLGKELAGGGLDVYIQPASTERIAVSCGARKPTRSRNAEGTMPTYPAESPP